MELKQQIKEIKNFAFKKMHNDTTGHNFDHIERVIKNVDKILLTEKADPLITYGAAYLHDVADDKLVDDPKKSENETASFLKNIELTDKQIDEIIYITHNLSFSKTLSKNPPKLSLAGQIVQDSDRLDAIGAIGITRAIYYGGANAQVIYDPAVQPRVNMDKKEYRNLSNETIINHFYEKLIKLRDMMNTDTAIKIAERRQEFMMEFLNEFKNEWNGEK
ncbi:HD superfamily hydrolase [Companilactobacillus tucceti DSM 20183]|uniref:HD superfamily hydrolase n=1 Tax=Companilactobacillus tucceti DSM 20183 TaxID=1423811 RepID=A0A0R1JAC1_9LACO|nr:HD domain-containing protein [Companilactobacillus tucceti]KRK65769.1 HD superfamily hydrolase [Companilactobacillus tucceti DSM 20183]